MNDSDIVRRQLDRRAVHPFQVMRRCPAGFPMVIESRPVSTPDRVFTTLYWLTCPLMRRHVGRYESAGWISRLEETCEQDAQMREEMNRLHLDYADRRRRAVGRMNSDPANPLNPNITASLGQTGIAGVADLARVKCLHAHAAYHLVRGDHPFFKTFPELLADESSCRECESLTDAHDADLQAS